MPRFKKLSQILFVAMAMLCVVRLCSGVAVGQQLPIFPGAAGPLISANRLRSLNGALRDYLLQPNSESAKRLSNAQSLLKVNTRQLDITVGDGIGPILNSPLLTDDTYLKNVHTLASLEAVARDSTPAPQSGIFVDDGEIPRIWGTAAQMLRQRFTVAVQSGSMTALCSGVLVAPDAVLTALHCACDQIYHDIDHVDYVDDHAARQSIGVKSIETFYIQSPKDPKNICKSVKGAGYPWLKATDLPHGEDLLLLKLQGQIPNNAVQPVHFLASVSQGKAATAIVVSGFGHSEDHLTENNALGTMVALGKECGTDTEAPRGVLCQATEEFIAGPSPVKIAGVTSDNDTCDGDSGGPALLISAESVQNALQRLQITTIAQATDQKLSVLTAILNTGNFVLRGITSRGVSPICGQGGIYTDLSSPRIQARLKQLGVNFFVHDQYSPL